jgi:hypothetical protein
MNEPARYNTSSATKYRKPHTGKNQILKKKELHPLKGSKQREQKKASQQERTHV